jgi:gamma-glutamyltranspeptidase
MRGVVACPQPLAAEIGAAILTEGGNASDAAIAAAVAHMVTDLYMCGLGGFGAATCAAPDGCRHLAFHARIGSRATSNMSAADCRGRLELGGHTLFDDHRMIASDGRLTGASDPRRDGGVAAYSHH